MLPLSTRKDSKKKLEKNICFKSPEDCEAIRTIGNKTAKRANLLKMS